MLSQTRRPCTDGKNGDLDHRNITMMMMIDDYGDISCDIDESNDDTCDDDDDDDDNSRFE